MKSFGIKRDAKDPRWEKFIEWGNDRFGTEKTGVAETLVIYGVTKKGSFDNWSSELYFDRIITLDEWEAEFMKPKLAGREYDEKLIHDWCKFKNNALIGITEFMQNRYAKQDRISEIKGQIEKLSNELKELDK